MIMDVFNTHSDVLARWFHIIIIYSLHVWISLYWHLFSSTESQAPEQVTMSTIDGDGSLADASGARSSTGITRKLSSPATPAAATMPTTSTTPRRYAYTHSNEIVITQLLYYWQSCLKKVRPTEFTLGVGPGILALTEGLDLIILFKVWLRGHWYL